MGTSLATYYAKLLDMPDSEYKVEILEDGPIKKIAVNGKIYEVDYNMGGDSIHSIIIDHHSHGVQISPSSNNSYTIMNKGELYQIELQGEMEKIHNARTAAGNIQNQGWEVTLNGTPILTSDFTWKTSINFSTNKNKIVKLHDELKELVYGPTSFSSSYAMKLVKGGSIGDIYGKAFVRDAAGNIVYETEGDYKGLPLVEGDGNTVKVGNANPVFMMRWDHTFSYKGFSLYFLLDWRYGGKVLSQTQAEMDLYGVSEITADARDRGYVMLEGQQIDNVKGFYKNVVGGRAGVTEYYMYDATNLRLREVSLSYNFSKKWIQKTKVLKDVQLSFVARNLCFLYKKAPFDPDLVLSTGNDNQGIEVFGMPTTRSLGFTLKCEF